MPGVTRASSRSAIATAARHAAGGGYRLLVDVFVEFGSRARITTWQLDVKRTGAAGTENEWTIADQDRISSVENLYRLSLNGAKQFAARDLRSRSRIST